MVGNKVSLNLILLQYAPPQGRIQGDAMRVMPLWRKAIQLKPPPLLEKFLYTPMQEVKVLVCVLRGVNTILSAPCHLWAHAKKMSYQCPPFNLCLTFKYLVPHRVSSEKEKSLHENFAFFAKFFFFATISLQSVSRKMRKIRKKMMQNFAKKYAKISRKNNAKILQKNKAKISQKN